MKRKILLAMVLVVCMVFTLLSVVALAEGTGGVTGTGTANDPYKIGSEADLFYFGQNLGGSVRGGTLDTEINKTKIYAELTADITLERAWDPISALEQGTFTHQYLIFDGKDHTITGMKVTATDINSGFFGKVGNSNLIDIKNLTINEATISLTQSTADADLGAGAFIGWCETSGASLTNCKLTNSTVGGGKNTGGLIGYIDYGEATITNCTVQDSTINAGARPAGGMVGYCSQNLIVSGGSVTGCTINYDSPTPTYTAGGQIIGRANHNMTFTKVEVSANTGKNLAAETLYGWAGSSITVTVEQGVNFDSQGGSDVDSITVEKVGDTINAPTSPTRSGYTFGGWYTESECANQFDFTTPITATITLYAKWTQNTPPSGGGSYTPPKYPVTDTNQGEQAGGQIKLSKERAEAGDTVIITVTPDKGYENGNPVVLDTNKKPVEVTDNGNGTFSFKMPSGGVNVETKFSKIDYFDDVTENDWFDEASWYCAAHGLIQGTGHRQFDGHIGTNRAMLVTVLYRLANSTDDLESIFDDVESGKWYSEAIGWAAHNKIVEGYGNGKFGPDDTLTREQMVAVLYRYSMFMKYDVSKLNSLNTFTDADAISEWALQAMKWAAGNGIVEGIGNDLISPETGATRAQFAAMMQRFCANFVK